MLAAILASRPVPIRAMFSAPVSRRAPGGHRGQGSGWSPRPANIAKTFAICVPRWRCCWRSKPIILITIARPAQLEGAFARFVAPAAGRGAFALCGRLRRLPAAWPRPLAAGANRSAWHLRAGRLAGRDRGGVCRPPPVCRPPRTVGGWASRALAVPGEHNVVNALAAIAAALDVGASWRAICRGLAHFAGLSRRLETICHQRRLAVVDDYAHLPTEIAASLATVRRMYPGRRLWCVFQPHQASRTRRSAGRVGDKSAKC